MRTGDNSTADREARDRRIVALYLAGLTDYQIAPRVGLSRPRVSQIRHENGIEARKWRNRDVMPKVWTTDRRVEA